ncbi:hypothetical protein CC79DRAFT_486036 [Sarocladium strictum]
MLITDVTDDFLEGDHLGHISRGMRDTGFHKWGFVVYRAVYGDDELWERYIAALKIAVHQYLVHCGREHLLEQYADWTVKDGLAEEERNTENAIASKDHVRRLFVQWRDQHEVRRSRFMFLNFLQTSTRLPRFTYCIYVDHKCLVSLGTHEKGKYERLSPRLGLSSSPLVVVLIDGDYELKEKDSEGESSKEHKGEKPTDNQGSSEDEDEDYSEDDEEDYPFIEGCTAEYVGWTYEDAECLAGAYHHLHQRPMFYPGSYVRPPALAPYGFDQVE